MSITFADLEARVHGLEFRATRNEEDIAVIYSTTTETLMRVQRVERGVDAIAAHLGVELDEDAWWVARFTCHDT